MGGNPEYEWGRPSYPITSPGKKDVRSPKRGEPGGGCLEMIALPALALAGVVAFLVGGCDTNGNGPAKVRAVVAVSGPEGTLTQVEITGSERKMVSLPWSDTVEVNPGTVVRIWADTKGGTPIGCIVQSGEKANQDDGAGKCSAKLQVGVKQG